MALANFASHLNLYSDASATNHFDLDVLADKTLLTVDQQLEIVAPALKLGAVPDVEAAIVAAQADLLSGASNAAAASNTVQTNLDNYKTSNDSAVGALQSSLSTESAQRQAADASQAQALAQGLVGEATIRTAAISQLTSDLSDEVSDRQAAISAEASARGVALASEASARAAAVLAVTQAVNVEKQRINAILSGSTIDLDSLKEVVDSFQAADSSLLGTLTALQAQVTTLESRLDSMTDP